MPRHACGFAGLSRSAYLYAVEDVYVADYHLVSELGEDYTTGQLAGTVLVANAGTAGAEGRLSVRLLTADGSLVVSSSHDVALARGGRCEVEVNLHPGRVLPWNDERPHLYRVELCLSVPGQPDTTVSYRTGFRRFELKGGRPRMNGRPVKFRGVNHLTYHPEHGLYTPKEWLRQCLALMKKANVNAIRTHFFSPPELCELCDEMGFYFLQELPIDWGHTYLHKPEWLGPVLYRLEGCVRRDRHHPSIQVWSVGNENMPRNDEEHDDFMNHLRICDRFVKRLDPTRPTMFPPPGPANRIRGILETRIGDIADIHYSFELIREFNETGKFTSPVTWEGRMETTTRRQALERGWSGVWFSSEYGIGNMQPDLQYAPYCQIISDVPEDPLSEKTTQQAFMDRLEREWGYMREDPTCLGGAYFPWIASGSGDQWGWMRWGEDADWGVVMGDLTPKPAFWGMRSIFSPIQFPRRVSWAPGQQEISFEIANGFNSIDLAECTLRTQMGGGPPYLGQMRSWKDVPVSGAPGETVAVKVPLWNPQSRAALEGGAPVVCRCTLLDPWGHHVRHTGDPAGSRGRRAERHAHRPGCTVSERSQPCLRRTLFRAGAGSICRKCSRARTMATSARTTSAGLPSGASTSFAFPCVTCSGWRETTYLRCARKCWRRLTGAWTWAANTAYTCA